jgi:hypothetical protein
LALEEYPAEPELLVYARATYARVAELSAPGDKLVVEPDKTEDDTADLWRYAVR